MNPINILLVEDDEVDVMDITRSLEKLKIFHTLSVARNGEEAVDILTYAGSGDKPLPDIVLIDINMPKMNGLELLGTIRNSPSWRHLKCFMLTTSDHKLDRQSAKELEVSGYIIKPLKLNSPANMDSFNLMIDLLNFKSI
jgi:CheY-like chemotaxis protein